VTDWTKVNSWTAETPKRRGLSNTDEVLGQVEREVEAEKEAYQRGLDDASDECDCDEEY
jgi:hypothetical protein